MAKKSKSAQPLKTKGKKAPKAKTKKTAAGPKAMPAKKPAAKQSAERTKRPRAPKRMPTARAAAVMPVLVVNMIPKSMSGEENQDSEPCIAVNPANAQQI